MGVDLDQPVKIVSVRDLAPVIIGEMSSAYYDPKGEDKLSVIKALLDAGANINVKDSKGHTALYYAMEKVYASKSKRNENTEGFKNVARFLVEKGAISE